MPAEASHPAALWFVGARCRPLWVRPIVHDDAVAFAAFVAALSPSSRRQRFHTALAELPPTWLRLLTQPDPATDLALVAVAWQQGAPQIVAEARYAADRFTDAAQREFALVVADGWRRQGLGRRLLRALAAEAARHGVQRLVGDVLRDNQPMLQLAAHEGFAPNRHPDDARLLRMTRTPQGVATAPAAVEPSMPQAWFGLAPRALPAALGAH